MSYSKDREWFVWRMSRSFPLLRLETLRALLLNAGTIQRAAEVDCSCSHEPTRRYCERSAHGAAGRLSWLVESCRMDGSLPGVTVTVDGDPRGYCCALWLPGQNTDTEEPFARIPAQGYSARQIERMGARQ